MPNIRHLSVHQKTYFQSVLIDFKGKSAAYVSVTELACLTLGTQGKKFIHILTTKTQPAHTTTGRSTLPQSVNTTQFSTEKYSQTLPQRQSHSAPTERQQKFCPVTSNGVPAHSLWKGDGMLQFQSKTLNNHFSSLPSCFGLQRGSLWLSLIYQRKICTRLCIKGSKNAWINFRWREKSENTYDFRSARRIKALHHEHTWMRPYLEQNINMMQWRGQPPLLFFPSQSQNDNSFST